MDSIRSHTWLVLVASVGVAEYSVVVWFCFERNV